MLEVAARFPNSGGMQRRRLGAAFEAKDAATALAALERLAAMGAVLSDHALEQMEPLVGKAALAPLARRFAANAAPLEASRLHATIPARHKLIEGVIWDPQSRRLYATAVVGRTLLLVGEGRVATAASEGLGSLLGGAYDRKRGRIWIASAALEPTPEKGTAFSGVVSIDPLHPERVSRIAAPEGVAASPGDVAVARDGTVYASDGLNGAIYRCPPGCERLEAFLPPGTFFSAQGLAFSSGQDLLYIADRRYGIAALERATGRLLKVTANGSMMLDGIDGLVWHEGSLIGIQTAYAPARIIRLHMARGGLSVERLEVLERAHPQWEELTLGAVAGDRFVYVANAQWARFGEGGAVLGEEPLQPTSLREIPLSRSAAGGPR